MKLTSGVNQLKSHYIFKEEFATLLIIVNDDYYYFLFFVYFFLFAGTKDSVEGDTGKDSSEKLSCSGMYSPLPHFLLSFFIFEVKVSTLQEKKNHQSIVGGLNQILSYDWSVFLDIAYDEIMGFMIVYNLLCFTYPLPDVLMP